MTIILQNQYEDLEVQNNHFSVTLSFQGKKENITIPFLSINKFCDPHNGFTLEMEDDYETDTKKNYKDNVINLFNKKIEGNSDDKY